MTTHNDQLLAFAREIMAAWPDGGIDGGDLQAIAERHGLLESVMRFAPCGDNCSCAEDGDFPVRCYRKADWLE